MRLHSPWTTRPKHDSTPARCRMSRCLASTIAIAPASSANISAPPPRSICSTPSMGCRAPPPPLTSHTAQSQDQLGLYTQDQIALGGWRLTLSGRHDWVETETLNYIAATRQNQDDAAFSGRAGLNYVFASGVSLCRLRQIVPADAW